MLSSPRPPPPMTREDTEKLWEGRGVTACVAVTEGREQRVWIRDADVRERTDVAVRAEVRRLLDKVRDARHVTMFDVRATTVW